MRITTTHVTDYVYDATNDDGHTARIDMRDGDKEHLGPMELVMSALAGCVAVEVASMLRKRRKNIEKFEIIGTGDRRETAPKSYTNINLHFKLTSDNANVEELEKVSQLSLDKYCSVADSLKADITRTCEVISA